MLDFINSPKELLNWMSKNIKYGFVGNDKKIYLDSSEEIFYNKYYLQSPDQLINNKIGVCWDQTELERYMFTQFKIPYVIIYIEQNNKLSSTHTFLVYKLNDKYYWFENSYEQYRGIHGPFNTIKNIINIVHGYMKKDNSDDGFKYYKLNKPNYHIGCQQFMDFAKHNLYLKKENKLMKRLIKKSMMDLEVFKGTIDKLGQSGRKILKELEEYKFELEQAGRIIANDPILTQKIVQKRKSLDQIAGQVYSIVFDIENIDITQAYEQQQMIVNNPDMGQPNVESPAGQPPMNQPGMGQQPPIGQPQPGEESSGAPMPSNNESPNNETPESNEEEPSNDEENSEETNEEPKEEPKK